MLLIRHFEITLLYFSSKRIINPHEIYLFYILRDSIILAILSCLTSIFCGFVIFPYIGYLSEITGQPIQNVITSSIQQNFK
jgi:hypothetical protein